MSCFVILLVLALFAGTGWYIGNLEWGPMWGVASAFGSMIAALVVVYVLLNVRR